MFLNGYLRMEKRESHCRDCRWVQRWVENNWTDNCFIRWNSNLLMVPVSEVFAELPQSMLTLLPRLMEPDPCLMFELIKNKQIVSCPGLQEDKKRSKSGSGLALVILETALVGGGGKNRYKKI